MNLRPARKQERLPSLDGWRALSILIVLLAHSSGLDGSSQLVRLGAWAPWLFSGKLGVRCFFVISGFLITYLLIKEHDHTGKISPRDFYIRRALRILPVYWAYLIVVAILQACTPLHQGLITWIGDLTFTVNFLPRGPISGQLWSLAVEEQFYLIWPFTLIWLIKRKHFPCWIFVLPVLAAVFCRFTTYVHHVPQMIHPLFHEQSSLLNFDALDFGCIAAFAATHHKEKTAAIFFGRRGFWSAVIGASLVILPSFHLSFNAVWTILGDEIQTAGFVILLLTSILQPRLFKPLNWRPVIQLGILSYSIYIWQQLFCAGPKTYGRSEIPWMAFPWWLVPALVTGCISYYGFEKPLLQLRARFRRD